MSIYFMYHLVYVGQVEQMDFVPLAPLLWERFPKNFIIPKCHRFPLAIEELGAGGKMQRCKNMSKQK